MRAVTTTGPGDPSVLGWGDVPDPAPPGPGEVLLDVVASAVNRADLLQRQGHYAPPPGASPILGLECSGRIAALGEGVEGWAVGDEVCALLSGGGYAEQVVIPVGQLLPVPAGVSLLDAAGLPEVACTVWSNVVDRGGLQAGEWLLVHGGASGIGTIATQLAARVLGAHVAVTASSADKLARCRELGAQMGVDYTTEDFVEAVREATGGAGADVVLDTVGGKYLGRNVDVLATGGRIVTIGLLGGRKGELDLGMLLAKRAAVHATSLRGRPATEKAAIVRGTLALVWPALEDGRIVPVVDRVLPMSHAAEAHRAVAASEHVGKVLLTVG